MLRAEGAPAFPSPVGVLQDGEGMACVRVSVSVCACVCFSRVLWFTVGR